MQLTNWLQNPSPSKNNFSVLEKSILGKTPPLQKKKEGGIFFARLRVYPTDTNFIVEYGYGYFIELVMGI